MKFTYFVSKDTRLYLDFQNKIKYSGETNRVFVHKLHISV
jgi:hypothetical protein